MPRKRAPWVDQTVEAVQDVVQEAVQGAVEVATRASLDAVDAALEATRASLGRAGGRSAEGTRARILDVALDLFLSQGYDKTSLREIAEKMGFTKAALYYHFASKAEIFGALHLRLHRLMDGSLEELGEGSPTPEAWGRFLDQMIGKVQSSSKLLLLHLRNQAVLPDLHIEGHHEDHAELEERMRTLLADTSIPLEDRLRMLTAMAAVFIVPMAASEGTSEEQLDDLAPALRRIIRDILRLDG